MFEYLWGKKAQARYLIIATILLLGFMLGARELWTMEARWADIVMNFFYRDDFLHPYLNGEAYYDKPLLSYWFMSVFYYFSHSAFALRLPSAIAAGVSVWAIFRLGEKLYSREAGLISAWMLLTTFYFLFFGRVASADMLNLCGTLLAVLWYVKKETQTTFVTYFVFFLIIALTSLCKGLLGAVLPVLVILPDLIRNKAWKAHFNPAFFIAAVLGVLVYCFPFWLSSHFNGVNYAESGLWEVFRENILRFYKPFDHRGSIATYFIYFPLYLLPWTFFFIPALAKQVKTWHALVWEVKWMCLATLLIFCFFTVSLSRRSYYILPILPYAILLTAHWIQAGGVLIARVRIAGVVTVLFYLLSVLFFVAAVPVFYCDGGQREFTSSLRTQATESRPWDQWRIVLYGAPKKSSFYIQSDYEPKYIALPARYRQLIKLQPLGVGHLRDAWPSLKALKPNQIIVTRSEFKEAFQKMLPSYRMVEARQVFGERLLGVEARDDAVAFIPG